MNNQTIGFYGKVPTHGDFVARRLPRVFLETWDPWLSEGLLFSREKLAHDWLELYLTSPIWRFAVSAHVCGPSAWAGILMPNVDKVNRHFPLTLVAELPSDVRPIQVLFQDIPWFSALTELGLTSLDDTFELDSFDKKLQQLGAPAGGEKHAALHRHTSFSNLQSRQVCLRWNIDETQKAFSDWPTWVGEMLARLLPCHTIWWTAGSPRMETSLLVCDGLPAVEDFGGFLNGQWD